MPRALADIASTEEWAAFSREIYDLFGFHCMTYNRENSAIHPPTLWANRLCRQIKESNEGSKYICAVSQQNLAAEAKQTGQPVVEECNGGFLKIVVPIFADGEYIGTFGGCGLLAEDGEIDSFLTAKTLQVPEEEVNDLLPEIKRTNDDEVKRMVSHMETRLEEMLSRR